MRRGRQTRLDMSRVQNGTSAAAATRGQLTWPVPRTSSMPPSALSSHSTFYHALGKGEIGKLISLLWVTLNFLCHGFSLVCSRCMESLRHWPGVLTSHEQRHRKYRNVGNFPRSLLFHLDTSNWRNNWNSTILLKATNTFYTMYCNHGGETMFN